MSSQEFPETEAEQDARDLADCRPSSVVSAAAGAAAFSGVGCFMLALQLIMIPSRTIIASSALAMEGVFGAAFVVMAIWLLKLRVLPAVLCAMLSFTSAFLIVGWSLFAMTRGLFTILGFAVPCLCTITGLLSLLAIGPAQRAVAARERLRQRGISLGL
jgi:hypothetical protein